MAKVPNLLLPPTETVIAYHVIVSSRLDLSEWQNHAVRDQFKVLEN